MPMSNKCYLCAKPRAEWKPKPELPEEAYGHLWGIEYNELCSFECYGVWWRGRMIFLTVRLLKKMGSPMPFEYFQEIFGFDEAGGYAQEKYRKMITSPFAFLCGLSQDNWVKLGRHIEKMK